MNTLQILIPALNPDTRLGFVVEDILNSTCYNVIIVNDGSDEASKKMFEGLDNLARCTVLHHAANLGKGRALKTGFNYILNTFPNTVGVVTVDADGQHLTKDVVATADALLASVDSLALGSRSFDCKNIPFKSRIGNKVTRHTIKALCGVDVPDTQTGLRGIPREFMRSLLAVDGEGFEFETSMLISAKEKNIPFTIVNINTVYLNKNSSTHFNPLTDSLKIYSVFIKFLFASFSSFLIDIVIFSSLVAFLRDLAPLYYIYIATAGARIVSAVYNYNVNKHRVFKNFEKNHWVAFKYIILSVVQLFISAYFVKELFLLLRLNESIIKIIVDMILFFLSFIFQREIVFKIKNK